MASTPIDSTKDLIYRLVDEGYNTGSRALVARVCHPEYVNESTVKTTPAGPAGLEAAFALSRERIGEMDFRVLDVLREDGEVAMLRRTSGRTGAYLGASGADRSTSQWTIAFFGLEGGRIRRHVSNWEAIRQFVQSGALPEQPPPGVIGPDLSDVELVARRDIEDLPSATGPSATCVRAASPREREEALRLVDGALDYEFGLGGSTSLSGVIADGAQLSFADFPTRRGPAGMAERRTRFVESFSAGRLERMVTVVESGRAAVRWTLHGTHRGPYLGLPASGRPFSVTGSSYARIEDGRITRWIEVMDFLRLLRSLGALANMLPGCYPDQ